MYELLFSKRGVVYGVGYTDAHARIPAFWILLVLALVIAVAFIINIRLKSWLLPLIAIGSIIVVALVAGTIVPAIVQSYVVKPSERAKEKSYIKREINGTRDAYDINLSLIHISEPTRLGMISYAVFCLK